MSEKREPGFDRTLALVLRIGDSLGSRDGCGSDRSHCVDGTIAARLELSGVLTCCSRRWWRLVAMCVLPRERLALRMDFGGGAVEWCWIPVRDRER